jgi:hypothetical protein
METYQAFKNEWNGRCVDYDHVNGYQCVDLILEFMYQCGNVASGISGNAIDYADKPSAAFVNATVKVTDGSKQPGDIIVLGGTSTSPLGHIALRDTNVDQMLEQNGYDGNGSGLGKDAIGVYGAIPYNRVVAVYRLKRFIVTAPAPARAPAAPAAPTIPEGSYTIIKAIHGYGDANNAANHISPADTVAPGNYHIFNQADGMVNVTSNPNAPGSWVNPSDNTTVVNVTPSQRVNIAPPLKPGGNPENIYVVIKTIPGYTTATNAGNHTNPAGQVTEGTYYVYNVYPTNANLINVTSVLGKPGPWINKADNVPEPAPEVAPPTDTVAPDVTPATPALAETIAATADIPWQKTYMPFPKPIHYVSTRPLTVKDLSGQAPDGQLPQYDATATPPVGIVSAYGTVTFEDGVTYYRLKTNNDPKFKYWYCVPKLDATTYSPNLLVMPANPLTPTSKVSVARDTLELAKARFEEDIPKFLDDVIPKFLRKPKNKK